MKLWMIPKAAAIPSELREVPRPLRMHKIRSTSRMSGMLVRTEIIVFEAIFPVARSIGVPGCDWLYPFVKCARRLDVRGKRSTERPKYHCERITELAECVERAES